MKNKKAYRIQHQRSVGLRQVLILQNRVIEAETAEQALRIAMHGLVGDCNIDARNDDLALVDKSIPCRCADFWKAELELYWRPAARVIGA
jgi:hypothetical protein